MKKCIIITTIHGPTKAIHAFIDTDYDLIVVGDKKTPSGFEDLDCIFLDAKAHGDLFPAYSQASPFNNYARKNIGYLYAITQGYELIAESDDDNIPRSGWGALPSQFPQTVVAPKYPNMYSLYADRLIWPRGFPLDKIHAKEDIVIKERSQNDIFVIQGLADNSPDVDAIFRLTVEDADTFHFDTQGQYALAEGILSPFNTQNTFWLERLSFPYLYLPSTTTSRYTDILKSYVAQFGIWHHKGHLAFIGANVFQDRNIHDFMDDFRQEIPMYMSFYQVMAILEKVSFTGQPQDLYTVYEALCQANIVTSEELDMVTEWIKAIEPHL